MARYIDANQLIKKFYPMGIGDGKYTINAKAVKLAIDNAPTADVVPESEVVRLKHILNYYALQYGTVTDKQKVIDEAKTEVAREIFEEIEKILIDSAYIPDCARFVDIDKLAELKKKYTEEKE